VACVVNAMSTSAFATFCCLGAPASCPDARFSFLLPSRVLSFVGAAGPESVAPRLCGSVTKRIHAGSCPSRHLSRSWVTGITAVVRHCVAGATHAHKFHACPASLSAVPRRSSRLGHVNMSHITLIIVKLLCGVDTLRIVPAILQHSAIMAEIVISTTQYYWPMFHNALPILWTAQVDPERDSQRAHGRTLLAFESLSVRIGGSSHQSRVRCPWTEVARRCLPQALFISFPVCW
jgi:hypothetical protein